VVVVDRVVLLVDVDDDDEDEPELPIVIPTGVVSVSVFQ
jgi:hypothetical protein